MATWKSGSKSTGCRQKQNGDSTGACRCTIRALSHSKSRNVIGPTFEIETVANGSRPEVVVHGEIDITSAPALDEALSGMHGDSVVVDLSQVTFIDSTGLRVLVMARTRLEADGSRLVLRAADDSPVVRTMRLAGLISDFQLVVDSDETAG